MNPLVLLVLTGKHKGKHVKLTEVKTVIGRDETAKIRIATSEISRQHCLLTITDQGLMVRDLGSRNGTFVNGAPIAEETLLKPGDTITTGPMTFELEGGETPKSKAAAITAPKSKKSTDVIDDEIAGWLTDEASEGLSSSDTTILSNTAKSSKAASESVEPPKAPKREFKSVAEEAEDIIRRHLESLNVQEG